MINQVVKSEAELLKLLRVEIKKAGKQCNPTKDEIREQIKNFMSEDELQNIIYPVYIFADFTFVYRGFDVDLLASSHVISKTKMQELIENF